MAPATRPMTRKTIVSKSIVMSDLPVLDAPKSRPGGFRRGLTRCASSSTSTRHRVCVQTRAAVLRAPALASALTREFGHLLLPMLAVEEGDVRDAHRAIIEAAHIDAKPVGFGTRHIEALDAADRAEMMLRGAGVEAVGRDLIRALGKAEALSRHDQMQIACLAADRAIAFLGLDLVRRQHLEAHRAAMAPATLPGHGGFNHARHSLLCGE